MANESPPNHDVRSMWQNQKGEGMLMSAEEVRRKAKKFQTKIFWRNAREYVAALVVVVFFGFQFCRVTDARTRSGFTLIIAGMLYVAWQLHRRGSSRGPLAETGLASGLQFYRRELERQRDLVQTVWRWYLGPLVPGWVALMIALGRTNPGHLPHFAGSFTLFNLFAALVFVFVWKLNHWAARRLQRRIDELDALGEPR